MCLINLFRDGTPFSMGNVVCVLCYSHIKVKSQKFQPSGSGGKHMFLKIFLVSELLDF